MTGKKQPQSASEYLRIIDVAAMLDCSTTFAYKLVGDGLIPALRVRGMIRIPREQFMAFVRRETITKDQTSVAAKDSAA